MLRRLFLLTLGFLPLQKAAAAPVDTSGPVLQLSLEDAVRYAIRHNITIRNARVDVALQVAKNREITGIALPQVNGKDEFNAYPKPVTSFVPGEIIGQPGTFVPVVFTPKFQNTASLTATQILFDGSIIVALQARKTLIALTELGVRASENDVRYGVRNAYYQLVIAQRQFDVLQRSLVISRKFFNDQQAIYREGLIEKLDVDRATVQLNNLANDSLTVSSQLLSAEQLLKYNMGMPLDRAIVLSDTAVANEIESIGRDLETTIDYSLRIDYRQLQTALRLKQYDLKRYQYKALPTLAAFGNYAYTYASNNFRDVVSFNNYINYSLVGFQLNVPIFSGFQRKYQVVQARLEVEKAENNLALMRQTIDFQTTQVRTALRNALIAVKSQQENLELAGRVLETSQRKYQEGVGSSLEVTQAQSELLRSQGNYFSALLSVVNARTELARASGTLSPLQQQSGSDVDREIPAAQPVQPAPSPSPVNAPTTTPNTNRETPQN